MAHRDTCSRWGKTREDHALDRLVAMCDPSVVGGLSPDFPVQPFCGGVESKVIPDGASRTPCSEASASTCGLEFCAAASTKPSADHFLRIQYMTNLYELVGVQLEAVAGFASCKQIKVAVVEGSEFYDALDSSV